MASNKQHMVVVGAGVVGLQISNDLLKAGHDVTIIASHFPGDESIDYASPWAGGHWRPHGTRDDSRQCRWDLDTYRAWYEMVKREEAGGVEESQRSGLGIRTSTLLWDSMQEDLPWFSEHVQAFKLLNEDELPTDVAFGVQFASIAINVPKYLTFVMRQVMGLGVVKIRHRFDVDLGLEGVLKQCTTLAQSPISAIVNASGMGGGALCNDPKVFPIRGQTVLVSGEIRGILTRQGRDDETGEQYISYAIPRTGSNTTVLGGSNLKQSYDPVPDPILTQSILRRARILCPDLLMLTADQSQFEILGVQVGLRPAREGGARVEKEIVGAHIVVHAYGHGGAGFQNSIGVSNEVTALLS